MASTDARPVPIKNTALRVEFPLYDAAGLLVTGATGLDSEVSKDAGTFADCTNEATEIATSSGVYYLDLTSTEMNADAVAVLVKSNEALTQVIILYPQEAGDIKVDVQSISGDSTAADNLEAACDGTTYNLGGGAIVAASVTGAVGSVTGNVGGNVVGSVASVTGAVGSVTGNVGGNVVGSVASVTGAVGSVTGNVGGNVTGSVGSVATDGIAAASVSAGAANKVADHVLRRSWATAAASSDGDTKSFRSLLGASAKLVNKIAISGATLTIYEADDTTSLGTQAVSTDAAADPITALDTA